MSSPFHPHNKFESCVILNGSPKRYIRVISDVSFFHIIHLHHSRKRQNKRYKYQRISLPGANAILIVGHRSCGQVLGYQILPAAESPSLSKHREWQPNNILISYFFTSILFFSKEWNYNEPQNQVFLNILQFLATEWEVEPLVSYIRRSFHSPRGWKNIMGTLQNDCLVLRC